MRDNYIKRNTLQTAQYRFAEFVIDAITGFPEGYVENSQVELTLTGTLTIREISRPVTWTVLARQAGNTLTATADTDIRFDEFGMDPPSVPIATAQDEIHIQVVLVAREG
jgi:polyisoprenoid-binding protein YceI